MRHRHRMVFRHRPKTSRLVPSYHSPGFRYAVCVYWHGEILDDHAPRAQRLLKDSIDVKSLAIKMAATEEVLPSLVQALQSISADNSHLIRQTSSTLAENQRNEIIRTFFAVAVYVFQVLAAFIPAIRAASSPSGGRIGTAMLLSWLFSVVL
jgi:hypothetical protein